MLKPKKPPPRSKGIQVRFSEEQYALLNDAAQWCGLEVAVYAHRVICEAIRRDLGNARAAKRLRGNTVKSDEAPKSSDEKRTRETASVGETEAWEGKPRGAAPAGGSTSGGTMGDAPDAERNPGAAA